MSADDAYEDFASDDELALGPVESIGPDTRIVGGTPAPIGAWPSTVMLVADNNYQVCTGTLIAPDLVLTAAHCLEGINVTHVISGASDAGQGGNWTSVAQGHMHPTYWANGGSDIAVLELAGSAPDPSITIAQGCISQQHVHDGAPAAIAGYGAISHDGNQGTTQLHQAFIDIRDADCSQDYVGNQWTTCDPALRPSQELFAGGFGVDTCFGDSGGPLYVQDAWGEWYVAGVTSRGAPDAQGNACGGGGVYLRPDAFVGWIEQVTGHSLPEPTCGPPVEDDPVEEQPPPVEEPTAPVEEQPPVAGGTGWTVIGNKLVMFKGTLGALELEVEGVSPADLQFDVVQDGLLGTADTEEDGTVLFRPHKGALGTDSIRLQITDATGFTAEMDITVEIVRGGGCDTVGASGVFGALALLPLLMRRRT